MPKRTSPTRMLVVDRDTRYGEWLRHHLGIVCPDCTARVLELRDFERWSAELIGRDCDLLLLAAPFGSSPEDPQAQGLELLRRLREKPQFPAIIAVAEEGNELTAVRALQLGALDYIPKRLLTPERLSTAVKLAQRRIEKRLARRAAANAKAPDSSIVVLHPADASESTAGEGAASEGTASIVFAMLENGPDVAPLEVTHGEPQLTPVPVREGLKEARAESGSAPPDAKGVGADQPMEGARPTEPATVSAAPASTPSAGIEAGDEPRVAAPVDTQEIISPSEICKIVESASEGESAEASKPPPARTRDSRQSSRASAAARASGEDVNPVSVDLIESDADESDLPLSLPADFIPGYTLHARVGESEKAAVYLATSTALGRKVALKICKTLRDETAGRQFLEREYTAIVAIRNPYVVQIYDYGVHRGYEYLVMEYFERGDLKARIQQGLSAEEALGYLEQIALGLRVVHHAGLLHRDLKPPNVMLRDDGDVALIDFGLARALDGSTPSTRIGILRGSPYYMSPEQALGEQLDARSDFYSLGIIFYEMLTGRKPYTGSSAMEVLQLHVNAPVPQLQQDLAHYQPLLQRLLAKSREDRFASASELIAAIVTAREISHIAPSAA